MRARGGHPTMLDCGIEPQPSITGGTPVPLFNSTGATAVRLARARLISCHTIKPLMPESLTILAPAKLNLALSVGPAAESGMHPISSWMVTIDLHDVVALRRLPHDRLSRYAILWHKEAKRPSELDWPL